METNNVFRLNLKTGSAENYVDPDELFEHCLEKNIIGVGWPVDEPVNSIEEWIKEGEKKYNSRSFIRAANNMWYYVKKMDKLNREFDHLINLVP